MCWTSETVVRILVPGLDFDRGRIEPGRHVSRSPVGEDRQGRLRAEDLQARGQGRELHGLTRLREASPRGTEAVAVSGLVQVMAEGSGCHDFMPDVLDRQILLREKRQFGDDNPIVEEGAYEGVWQIGVGS